MYPVFQMSWDYFPPLFWAVFIPVALAVGAFVIWDFRLSILRGIRMVLSQGLATLKMLKSKLWRKQVVVPVAVFLSVVLWRVWPFAFVFTGANMKSSKDFTLLEEHLPPKISSVEIYEGLSHPFFEKDELTHEILFGSRKIIHGHGFASGKIEPNEVTQAIEEELWSGKVFSPWWGEKMCGGFHADYCLRWESDGVRYDVMICLGCGEALLFRDGDALRCDLQHEFDNRLRDLAHPDQD